MWIALVLSDLPGACLDLAFLVTFYCGGGFSFSHLCGFFVKFTAVDFRQYPGFFAGSFKTSQRKIERFVFSYFYTGHKVCGSCFYS